MERVVEGHAGVASVGRSEQEREWKGAMTKQASRTNTDTSFLDSSDFFSDYSVLEMQSISPGGCLKSMSTHA